MKSSKGESAFYAPLPVNPDHHNQQHVVVLTRYRRPSDHHERRRIRLCLSSFSFLLLLSAAVFLLYPSDPSVSLQRVHLNHVGAHTSPKLTLDASFSLTIKVRNRDFFSLDYDSLAVRIGYRGRELGVVRAAEGGGRVRARGASYVNATLVVDGMEVIHDVFYLLEDLAKGEIPFDTDSEVDGTVGLFFFRIPIKGRAACEVYVDTNDQTVVRQDCYPE